MKLLQRLIWPLALILFCLAMAPLMRAQEPPPSNPYHSRLYTLSVASLIGANALDAASSYGKAERNPLLGQRFDERSLGVKTGLTVGGLIAQRLVLRRHPEARKTAALVNFVVSGVLIGVSIHNFGIRK